MSKINCALIMAGGRGTRFWPKSTEEKPKQFLELVGNKTMIQETFERINTKIPVNQIFVVTCEKYKELVPMQPGDVPVTFADTTELERDFGFKPSTSLREGLRKFAEWYKEYYK